jgi:hypothetical protein
MFANSLGAAVIAIDLLEGGMVDIVFFIAQKVNQEETKLGWALACGISCFVQQPVVWAINGFMFVLPVALGLVTYDFAFISGIMFGLLAKLIRDGVIRAGVPVPFSIPASIAPESYSNTE